MNLYMSKEAIFNLLKKLSAGYDPSGDGKPDKLTAQNIGDILGLRRNEVSHYLNLFNKEGQAIKINSRPVYFIHRETLEKKLSVSLQETVYSSLDEILEVKNNAKGKGVGHPFDKVIGSKGSLMSEIEQCKAAVTYPPNGLPILITGQSGVGKSYLANIMWEYAVINEIVDEKAPFVTLNCAEYADNPELLTSNLFGHVKGAFTGADSSKAGLIEEADGGFLFLDEIHRLSPNGQEKLFLFMDKGIYRRMGEHESWRKAKVKFIFATTEKPNEVLIPTFLRRIPIIIELPALQARPLEERFYMINYFFREESINIGMDITVSQNVVNMLLNNTIPGNVGQLKNIIKYACAKAYLKHRDTKGGDEAITINISCLPEALLNGNEAGENITRFQIENSEGLRINRHDSSLKQYTRYGNTLIEDLYRDIFGAYDGLLAGRLDKSSYIDSSFKTIDKYFDDMFFDKKDGARLDIKSDVLKRVVGGVFEFIRDNYRLKLFNNTKLIISNYIEYRMKSGFMHDTDKYKNKRSLSDYLKNEYNKEFGLVQLIIKHIESNLDVKLQEDLIVLTLYIKGLNRDIDINRIRAVIIAHGISTASSIANVANRLLGQYIFESFDMPMDMSINSIIKQLLDYIKDTDTSQGIIILVDMGSLEEIYMSLEPVYDGTIGIVNNINTQLALNIGNKIIEGFDIEKIIAGIEKNNFFRYKIVQGRKHRKKAIITTCITGIGTAAKIRDLLEDVVGRSRDNIAIMAHDYISLKNNGKKDDIFKEYEVIGIVGTTKSSIEDIPFISVEDIISGTGEQELGKLLGDVLDEESIENINRRIVKSFSLQSVLNYLTILNPDKVINDIEEMIKTVEEELGQRFTNSVKISLFVHISCLIERLIKKEPIESYNDLEEFVQCQKSFIRIIRKSFSVIEKTYRVNINDAEIGYIYDIINLK